MVFSVQNSIFTVVIVANILKDHFLHWQVMSEKPPNFFLKIYCKESMYVQWVGEQAAKLFP